MVPVYKDGSSAPAAADTEYTEEIFPINIFHSSRKSVDKTSERFH